MLRRGRACSVQPALVPSDDMPPGVDRAGSWSGSERLNIWPCPTRGNVFFAAGPPGGPLTCVRTTETIRSGRSGDVDRHLRDCRLEVRANTMSNHSGSHLLNRLLVMLERESYFSEIGPDKTTEFVVDVVGLARDYDATPARFSTVSASASVSVINAAAKRRSGRRGMCLMPRRVNRLLQDCVTCPIISIASC